MQTGTLGNTVFEVSSAKVFTPNGISMVRDMKYEDHEVQGNFPRPEYLAPGLMSVTLGMTLRADLGVDPIGEAEKLEDAMLDGEVLRLVLSGQNLGEFTIRKIDQSWRHMVRGQTGPLIIEMSLELKEYF